tara:strand:- start:385 stop:591 length:207 start_codon:yes stop_codon:yes gene_type:complete
MADTTNHLGHIQKLQIREATIKFTDELQIRGSVGSFDLYTLLEGYICDKGLRLKINDCIKDYKNSNSK